MPLDNKSQNYLRFETPQKSQVLQQMIRGEKRRNYKAEEGRQKNEK